MNNTNTLREKLLSTSPVHDTPIGIFHPYWARKPQNIVNEIIKCFTSEGDKILDPFMGSGTSIFGAISLGRSIMGSDLSPLSVFLVKSIVELGIDPKKSMNYIDEFLEEFSTIVLPWFSYNSENEFIERERYKVIGDFKNGNFKLKLTEIVSKEFLKGKWTKRKVYNADNIKLEHQFPEQYLNSPINFNNIELTFNSRIAIPEGANLSHYFLPVNIAAINLALKIIERKKITRNYKNILKLLLSSAFPLLRLSDKKASSQWPYWRPKEMLTSRNPVIILQERAKLLKTLNGWVLDNLKNYSLVTEAAEFFKTNKQNDKTTVFLETVPVQNLSKLLAENMRFKLVFTDPPYSDQVPYLEYAAMWTGILGLKLDKDSYKKEIVISDSPQRKDDTMDYTNRIGEGFNVCCNFVEEDGYLIWYYLDYDLKNWKEIVDTGKENNTYLVDILPIKKQRRSIKTVTSPGKTLDGDMISIFKKVKYNNNFEKNDIQFDMIEEMLCLELSKLQNKSLINQYAYIIKYIIQNNLLDQASVKYKSIKNLYKHVIK